MPDIFRDLIGQTVANHRPWPRIVVDVNVWSRATEGLGNGNLTLLGLWGESDVVHMALADAADASCIIVLSLACPEGQYPSVGRMHPPAIRLERAVIDLFQLTPIGIPDARPWLDHGKWDVRAPLGARKSDDRDIGDYAFLAAEGENIHQVPVGPVHAGIIEPGHFRFSADGESIVRLEERLGYAHKGLESLFQGADLARAARLVGRCSGDSTVAYAIAFSLAVEAALGWAPPERAVWLRALMAELERLANHLGDIGTLCNDAAFPLILSHCAVLRESILREAKTCFGHRLMMDCVLPGGVNANLDQWGAARMHALVVDIAPRLRQLLDLYDKTASLQDRTVGAGVLRPGLARQYGAGGFVGRASGRRCDVRRKPGYEPYTQLAFEVPVLEHGDVDARLRIRAHEAEQSLSLIAQIIAQLPTGAIRLSQRVESTDGPREGMALAEGFRGDILVWIRIDEKGRVLRCHVRDPSWFQWPLLEAAIEGNILADFPLCNKSFNCSYSGHDL